MKALGESSSKCIWVSYVLGRGPRRHWYTHTYTISITLGNVPGPPPLRGTWEQKDVGISLTQEDEASEGTEGGKEQAPSCKEGPAQEARTSRRGAPRLQSCGSGVCLHDQTQTLTGRKPTAPASPLLHPELVSPGSQASSTGPTGMRSAHGRRCTQGLPPQG